MKRILYIAAALLIVFLICAPGAPASTAGIGTIIGISGQGAKVVVQGTDYEKDAAAGDTINSGDTIVTPAGCIVSILMADGSQFAVNENTRVTIRGRSNPGVEGVELDEGELWGEMADLGGELEVGTPSGVVAVRGTELNVKAGGAKTTVTMIQGDASFFNNYGSVELGAGMQSSATPTSAPTPPAMVDPRFFIEWTANVESIGASIELPLVSPNRYVLEDMLKEYEDKSLAIKAGADVFATLAGIYYDLGMYEDAEEYFNLALEKDGQNIDAVFGLGITMIQTGRSEEAITHYAKYLGAADNGSTDNYLTGLGLAHLKMNDLDEADTAFDKTLDEKGDTCIARVGKGVAAMKRADIQSAADNLKAARNAAENCYQADIMLAELDISLGNMNEALKLASDAAEKNSFSPAAHATLARVYFFRDNLREAKVAARRAVELDPFNSSARDTLAMVAVAEGQLRTAKSEALRAIALDKHNAHAHDVLAQVYMLKRRRAAAIIHWQRAIEAQPNYVPARLHLAQMYNTIHKPAEAEEHLRHALEIEPDNDALLAELGRANELKHEFDDAERLYREAIENNPQRATTHARLASYYLDRFKLQPALLAADEAIKANPGHYIGYYVKGLIHDELDNTESATFNYKQALRLNPDSAEARYRLGVILGEDRSRFFEALSEMRRAELIEPTVIVREELRDNTRVSTVHGDDSYHDYTVASTGYADNRNFIYKVRLSDTRTNYHTPPKNHEYDPNLGLLYAGGIPPNESLDQAATVLVNYRPDYYSSVILSLDSGLTREGYASRSGVSAAYDTTNYVNTNYRRSEINGRRIMGPKSALNAHISKTNSSEYRNKFTLYRVESTDFENDYTEYELMYETKYCKACWMNFGAAHWDSTIQQDNKTDKTLDYNSWSTSYSATDRADYRETILYTDHKFRINPYLNVKLRGEKSDHDAAGARDTGQVTITYRLNKPDVGLYYREGQRWYINAAESLRPAESWAYLGSFYTGVPGQRSHYREFSADAQITPTTYAKAVYYEKKRKTYSQSSGFNTVDSRRDEEGYNAVIEQQLGPDASLHFDYTERDLIDPLNRAVVTDEPLYIAEAGLHYFINSKWHTRLAHHQQSSYYTSATPAGYADGYGKTDLLLYFEPDMKQRYFLHLDNLFTSDIADTRTGLYDDGITIRVGGDHWF